MTLNDTRYGCNKTGLPPKELTEKICQIDKLHPNLARAFTKTLNEKGISGSVLAFSVYDRTFDDALKWIEETQGIAFWCWT
ncbi:MAG: hypothetical protein AB1Z29_15145 [Desulfobacterales bacterium]|jgi:hypothetical protein